jgi:hypothetical protein
VYVGDVIATRRNQRLLHTSDGHSSTAPNRSTRRGRATTSSATQRGTASDEHG